MIDFMSETSGHKIKDRILVTMFNHKNTLGLLRQVP